jgi:hypothetical protein
MEIMCGNEGRKKLSVITLALDSQARQRLAKVHAKNEAQESHFMLLRM